MEIRETLGFVFWNRVDAVKRCSLLSLAEQSGQKYSLIKTQRSLLTVPKAEVVVRMASVLGTTAEYLLTGETGRTPEDDEAIALYRALKEEAPAVLEGLIATYLVPKKDGQSSALA